MSHKAQIVYAVYYKKVVLEQPEKCMHWHLGGHIDAPDHLPFNQFSDTNRCIVTPLGSNIKKSK